jgi:ferredoxin--NADP+ reductase
MTYVITQNCCNDATCADVCPVGCIHPTPDEPGYATAEMLYIDPQRCIDCAACVEACPVDAISPADELPPPLARYAEINADYYRATSHRALPLTAAPRNRVSGPLRVAVVGAGPSGFYAAEELLESGAEVSMFDRLPTPFGLVRAGVAPDHDHTKKAVDQFRWTAARPEFRAYYNVEIGDHLTHAELLDHHHAVLYSVGALHDRHLGIPGEELAGSHSAADFVTWYNGHPDRADHRYDLRHLRAVVIGNGNVALDIARILLAPVEQLARTDIADHALKALAASNIDEVVVLGRRGPEHAAFTTPEILAFSHLDDIDVVVEGAPGDSEVDGFAAQLKARVLTELSTAPRRGTKRLLLKFLTSPVEILGDKHVTGLRVTRNHMIDGKAIPTGESELIETGLILRSVGFRGRAIQGVPFDESSGTIPNDRGRVIDPETGETVPGIYTAGWIKRGPSGVIGTNKTCAAETVTHLLADFAHGRLPQTVSTASEFDDYLARRHPQYVNRARWQRIDDHERDAGRHTERPAVKITDLAEMLQIAQG